MLKLYTEYSGKELHRGDVAFIPQYIFHKADLYTPDIYDRVIINVTNSVLTTASGAKMNLLSCFEPVNDPHIHTVHFNDAELEELLAHCHKLSDNLLCSNPGSDILSDAYFKIIMEKLTSRYTSDPIKHYPNIMPPLVSQTFEYIDKHLTEDISLKDLENEIHHNGTYISRCIKNISGLSLQQYLIAKRIALSCKLLKEGKTASEACYLSGFNNYSNFSRTFTKQMGQSPKQIQMAWKK